jgi:hypothetical protein
MKYVFLFLSILPGAGLFAQTQAGVDFPAVTSLTMAELRTSRPISPANKVCYVTDPGKEGLFRFDPQDTQTVDDSAMTIVTPNGGRFKRQVEGDKLNVRWFGATGNGGTDDWYALQKGINYIVNDPSAARTLYFPPGTYRTGRPLIIARFTGTVYRQASVNLLGPANAKDVAIGGATIVPAFNNTFAIGVQMGKGVEIRNLGIRGQFTFPNGLSAVQVDTLSFNEWADGSARDNRVSPYAGVVIDPFSDSTAYARREDMYPGLHAWCPKGIGRGGSTAVQVIGCSITNFIVGMMITPSNQQNGELVDVIDCDISCNKVGYAMGQAQSKECHVDRLKCWGPTHTLFDNVAYGFRHGDGAAVPMVDGVNIAGHVKQLCAIYAPSFGGTFRNVYAEGLFRVGFIGGFATVSFEDCQLNFETESAGKPYPDFFILGSSVTFHSCMLRSYTTRAGLRLLVSGTTDHFIGGVMNEPPIAVNLDNNGIYPNPTFDHVQMYFNGGILGSGNPGWVSTASPIQGSDGRAPDPVYYGNSYLFRDPFYGTDLLYKLTYRDNYERTVSLTNKATMHVDKRSWTAWFKLPAAADTSLLLAGDFILTRNMHYQAEFAYLTGITYPVGIIRQIRGDTVFLDNLAIGIQEGMKLPLWMDYYVDATPPFTGDIAAGSNTITHAQGTLPDVGQRPDMPMLPSGTYVTAVDPGAGTIRLSTSNGRQSFADFTFMNGYPTIEMYSSYDLKELALSGKTLIGGATFFQYSAANINTHEHDYPVNGSFTAKYKIINTNIRGDTSLHKFRYVPVP